MLRMIRRVWVSFALICAAFGAPAALHAAPLPRVAVLAPENRSGDPRYDYLGAITHGLLLYDLSATGAVELAERGALDAALKERELSLSAVAADPSKSFEGIMPADYLIAGEYLLIGTELRLTLKLVDVAAGRVSAFSESGSTENLVHALAERLLERLTGKRPVLQDDGRSRSILSLRDETPGSIALHSPLIDARILLDGDFIGYTTGDRRKPYIIENLEPGMHELSTDLGRDFGVMKLPEIAFAPWKETFKVQSGKRLVVTDPTSHFNEQLYRLKSVFSKSQTLRFDASARFAGDYPFSFIDRKGVEHSGRVEVELRESDIAGSVAFELDGERRLVQLKAVKDTEAEFTETIGLIEFSLSLDYRYDRVSMEISVERRDVDQGMHRE